MNKQDAKNILISMRKPENETFVNYLLGQIDMMDDQRIADELQKLGNDEGNVRSFFEGKIAERTSNRNEEKFSINDMFTYGISGNCVHLHLPGSLMEMMKEKGMSKTMDTVNLYLLDAIDRLSKLKQDGFYKFQDIDNIYMISPIMIGRETQFLEGFDFETHSYRKKELRDPKFVQEHPEAQLATHIFGKDRNVGTALISFDTISTPEWQSKKRQKIQEFSEKGITLSENSQVKE